MGSNGAHPCIFVRCRGLVLSSLRMLLKSDIVLREETRLPHARAYVTVGGGGSWTLSRALGAARCIKSI